ncbi:MAG: type II secretion system protein [Planctomycetes bacterium]|nr:type II secretion system protein [Planctomycetota bacterium]
MKKTRPHFSSRVSRGGVKDREGGMTLLEIMISLTILSMILLGVMASISTGFQAQHLNTEQLNSQLLVQQVIEELQDNSFDNLVTFNGQTVTSGAHTAAMEVGYVNANLVRVTVTTSSTQFPTVSSRAVTYLADRD